MKVKIIGFGDDNYLVLSDDTPIFELTIHCSKEDLALFDPRELYQITDRIFREYKKSETELEGKDK